MPSFSITLSSNASLNFSTPLPRSDMGESVANPFRNLDVWLISHQFSKGPSGSQLSLAKLSRVQQMAARREKKQKHKARRASYM
ncbi:hypothetical protein PILCRDRAFT_743723 [Piloderma croceum F 1598]|uniref:Uncharacterized protein n=1 Tax=Piloderma croceum (strain F 1598) TaxID=765440 RepID=A0A0C3AEP0_PILCF|nr:hypothetical protein PILCRDRAFT_743723 [Piloderma croceum F 1598]